MTIAAETNRVTYSCNGVLTDFSFDFLIFDEDDLKVTITDSGGTPTVLAITTDYTVAGENGKFQSGGTVSTVKEIDGSMQAYAWATGYTITIELNLDLEQTLDLVRGGTYSNESLETALDRLTKITQQLNDAINRSIVLSTASELSGLTIPDLIAGRYLYAADAETLGWAVSVDTTALTVSDWAKTLLDDVNADAALTTLEFSTYIKTLIDDTSSSAALKTLLSFLHSSITKTATYTVTTADRGKLINFDCTSGNLVAELPAVATAGNGFAVAIKKTDSSGNYLEIDGLIDGGASHFLRLQNDTAIIVCDGTNWKIVSRSMLSFLASLDLTNHGILLGSGTGPITPTAAMTDGQLLVGQSAADPLPKTASGDVTINKDGVLIIGSSKVITEKIADANVTQAKLKTSIGSVNVSVSPSDYGLTGSLPGGQYGFSLQTMAAGEYHASLDFYGLRDEDLTTSYVSPGAYFKNNHTVESVSGYAQQRYITSSGEIHWIFILRDKVTKAIKGMYQAPDHPCFGNGGKPLLMPHPFGNYDEETQEIIVINPTNEEIEQMESETIVDDETKPDKDLLEVIMENYEIDEDSKPKWPTKPVTVGLPKHIVDKKGKKILADYRFMPGDTIVEPVKKVIPQPPNIIARSLRRKHDSTS